MNADLYPSQEYPQIYENSNLDYSTIFKYQNGNLITKDYDHDKTNHFTSRLKSK